MRLLTFFLALFISQISSAEDLEASLLLDKYLYGQYEKKSNKEVWLWNASTADIYSIEIESNDLDDYLYILLYQYETATLLEHAGKIPKFRELAVEYPQILNRMVGYCEKDEKTAHCILDGMKTKLKIVECFARVDEGYLCKCGGVCEKL